MAAQKMSVGKAHTLSFGLFLIGIGILFYVESWWPAITLVVGLPITFRQYLLGHTTDMIVSFIISVGIFVTVQFNLSTKNSLPVLFIIGGLYIFIRELFFMTPDRLPAGEENSPHKPSE